MIFKFLVIIYSFLSAAISLIVISLDFAYKQEVNWMLVGAFIFFALLILCLIIPIKEKTKEQIQAEWKYKDYQSVYDYLDNHKPHLKYGQEDKERLAILLFFDWIIKDDSNTEALVLNRKTTTSDNSQIFKIKK